MPLLTPTQQRRLEEQPVFPVAADDGVRALAEGVVDVRGDLLEALLVDERAHLGLIVHRIADAQLAHAVGHLLGERRLNPARARRCGSRRRRSGRRCETSTP